MYATIFIIKISTGRNKKLDFSPKHLLGRDCALFMLASSPEFSVWPGAQLMLSKWLLQNFLENFPGPLGHPPFCSHLSQITILQVALSIALCGLVCDMTPPQQDES